MPTASPSSAACLRRPQTPLRYVPRHRAPPLLVDADSKKRISSLRARRVPLILGSVTGAGLLLYCIAVCRAYAADAQLSKTLNVPEDASDRYNYTASRFDNDVSTIERVTFIDRRRAQLCEKARGHVLEVSAGTGRNSKHLPLLKGVKSVTLVDKSRGMIDEARRKWPEEGNAWFIRTAFRVQDCRERVPCPSPAGFDTIIQTMGLCSTGDPEILLRNLGEMTNPDGGRILLLEHGKGHYAWLNSLLDAVAPVHADRHGCWWNKDIGKIVQRSGLEVVEQKRFNFGTTWWFELRPKPHALPEPQDKHEQSMRKNTSWLSWLGLKGG